MPVGERLAVIPPLALPQEPGYPVEGLVGVQTGGLFVAARLGRQEVNQEVGAFSSWAFRSFRIASVLSNSICSGVG